MFIIHVVVVLVVVAAVSIVEAATHLGNVVIVNVVHVVVDASALASPTASHAKFIYLFS